MLLFTSATILSKPTTTLARRGEAGPRGRGPPCRLPSAEDPCHARALVAAGESRAVPPLCPDVAWWASFFPGPPPQQGITRPESLAACPRAPLRAVRSPPAADFSISRKRESGGVKKSRKGRPPFPRIQCPTLKFLNFRM